MNRPKAGGPYRALGQRLKDLRFKAHESLAEASGAVEIDVRELASFELGDKRPSEDVLLLLISHFGAQDDEAVNLWEMAGYTTTGQPDLRVELQSTEPKTSVEGQILFTDVVDVVVNNFGVVMNFMQSSGPNSAPVKVARVGMSREHAKSVMEILQATLGQIERHQNAKKNQTNNT